MQNKIQTLFIDMDGTLIDTDTANTSAYNFALKQVLGKSIDLQAHNLTRVTGQTVKTLFPSLSESSYKEIKSVKNREYVNFLPLTKVNREVVDFIKSNSKKTIVLVSKANHKRVVETLKYHNLLDYFDYFYCNESKMRTKTYNKYLDAVIGLGVSPSKVIVFENEDLEIANALVANIPFGNIKKIGE